MNNSNIKNTNPLIFNTKVNNKHKIIPLNVIYNTIGPVRHYPPATKEWYNSIYAYNNNTIKNLSIENKNLNALIKSYFNLHFSNKFLKTRKTAIRFKRLSLNKIFFSRAELKHTNSKVIITLYVYNEEKRKLNFKLKEMQTLIFSPRFSIEKKLNFLSQEKERKPFINYLKEVSLLLDKKLKENLILEKKIKISKRKQLFIDSLETFKFNIDNAILLCENSKALPTEWESFYEKILRKTELENEITLLANYRLLLNLNRSKFEDKFLSELKSLVSRIYNKEVEFNIVNLKTLYLNSDIFTEAISLKMKNRGNKLLKILKSSLRMVKLPYVNTIKEKNAKNNKNEQFFAKVKNLQIVRLLNKHKGKDDMLNKLLLNTLPNSLNNKEKLAINVKDDKTTDKTIQNIILDSLKYKSLAGVRLEAKGRLTRRLTASRSVFKLKWKGSLKNIDSSYKGISSVILRGHAKSNLQYSIINSKTRNGAFGLKGWINSK